MGHLARQLAAQGHRLDRLSGSPWEFLSLGVAVDRGARVVVDRHAGRAVNQHKGRDPPHPVQLAELPIALVAGRDGKPRHRRKVRLELAHVFVTGDEDDLELLARCLQLLVCLDQKRRERLARWAPASCGRAVGAWVRWRKGCWGEGQGRDAYQLAEK